MTIRLRLTMAAIAVILVTNALLSLVAVEYAQRIWLGEVQSRVRLDLNSAWSNYRDHMDDVSQFLRALSLNRQLADAVKANDREQICSLLKEAHVQGGMDILNVVDHDGVLLCRARDLNQSGDDLSGDLVVAAVLESREPATGTTLWTREQLLREGKELADRALFELLPTPAARPTDERTRSDGMVVAAAVPILDAQKEMVGILYGGNLLNRRYEIVDAIKTEVFPRRVHRGKDIGTVTVFQGDLRISTNVKRRDGSRAVGTRLSEVVYEKVLVHGGTWADRAFVVNDWYITAYEPIRNPQGEIIGALYVGLLEAPFVHQRNTLTWVFLAMVTAATVASLILVFFVTRQVLYPIGRIIEMHHKVVDGDLSVRIGIRPPGEMGELCQAIDSMADAVAARERQLKRVARQQIGQSEKLAAVGRLAAGVAHEINNPLTGVLTFSHLLREKPNMDEQDKKDLDLIIRETVRAGEIVRGLLDFARERPSEKKPLDLNDVIRRTIQLLGNQKAFRQITVTEDLQEDLPLVNGDLNQLQQVLINLSLNACEAMPDGGTLLISSAADNGDVYVKVSDTGCGISHDDLDQIFEPFFSTKPVGKGTGLGLSVSYGIVKRHGGTLGCESEDGKGSTFTVTLPSV